MGNTNQENNKLKVENWKAIGPESNHCFRPYLLRDKENCEENQQPHNQQQSAILSEQTGVRSGRFTGNDGIDAITDSIQYNKPFYGHSGKNNFSVDMVTS